MKKYLFIILLILISPISFYASSCSAFSSVSDSCYSEIFTSLTKLKKAISDEDSITTFNEWPKSQIKDINNDNVNEIVLTSNGCNHNCTHVLVTTANNGYRIIGFFSGGRLVKSKLPKSVPVPEGNRVISNGYSNLSIHNHSGLLKGSRFFFVYNGTYYIMVSEIKYDLSKLNEST